MRVDGVERRQERLEVTIVGAGLAGRGSLTGRRLTLAELRWHFQRLGDAASNGYSLNPGGRRVLARAVEMLRERVDRFNRKVPAGLKVELNPQLSDLLAEAPLAEA